MKVSSYCPEPVVTGVLGRAEPQVTDGQKQSPEPSSSREGSPGATKSRLRWTRIYRSSRGNSTLLWGAHQFEPPCNALQLLCKAEPSRFRLTTWPLSVYFSASEFSFLLQQGPTLGRDRRTRSFPVAPSPSSSLVPKAGGGCKVGGKSCVSDQKPRLGNLSSLFCVLAPGLPGPGHRYDG